MRRIILIAISSTLVLYTSLFAVFSCADNPMDSSGALPGDNWREVFPSQDPAGLQHIVAIGASFVGVASDNKVYASTDGGNWRQIGLAAGSWVAITALIRTGKTLIAVGSEYGSSRIYVSETGESWKQRNVPDAGHLTAATSSGEIIVAVGRDKRALRKESDADWELVDISDFGRMWDVTWDGGRFLATHSRGILSSIDGREWMPENLDIQLGGSPTIANSGKSVVAIGTVGGFVTSDGVVWDSIPFFGTSRLSRRVFWEGSRYVAFNDIGSIAFSSDGVTWEEQHIRFLLAGGDIAWNGAVYSLTGSRNVRMTAPDTVNWTVHSFSRVFPGRFRSGFSDIATGDGEIIAMGGSTPIMNSSDGTQWTGLVPPFTYTMNSLTWSGERYVAVGNGDTIYTSMDGVNWQSSPLPNSHTLEAIHSSNGRFVAVGGNAILFSENGLDWESVYTDTILTLLEAITTSESLWLAVGLNGDILSSPDGKIWTRQESGTSQQLIAADWTGKEFLVAGSDGAILRSTDGVVWELLNQFNGFGFTVHDAVWANGRYVVVGTRGLVITSDDLINWINRDLEPRTTITSITWDGRRLFAIHGVSRIIVSP